MKKQVLFFATTLLSAAISFAGTTPVKPKQSPAIAFTQNKGQIHDQNYKPRQDVLYGVTTGNMAVHIKNNGVSYQLYKSPSPTLPKGERASNPQTPSTLRQAQGSGLSIYRIDLTWLNANTNFTTTEDEALPGYNNYYLESCPNGALNVKSYKGITLHNLYKGINLHYYEKNGELKHDYIVAPHADYKQIQLQIEGAEISVNEDGSLILSTPLGKVQEGAPIVYQNGKQLKARWVITPASTKPSMPYSKARTLHFEIENYKPEYELIIDPVTRAWGTYYGGTGTSINGNDEGVSTCTDANGNVYLAGFTTSTSGTIIATTGSHQLLYGGSNGDAFLAKFDFFGTRVWGTYYGGSAGDSGGACTCDGVGDVYLVGTTWSGTAIATAGSHQTTFQAGGATDAFIAKFNSNGVRQWSSYYGGGSYDSGLACSTDTNNNVYIAGQTNSTTNTLIASPGSHQPTFIGWYYVGFLAKFSSSGTRQWGTYYGVGGDFVKACATDPSGNVYIAGQSENTGTIIATPGSHQSSNGGGSVYDAFLVKFNSNGVRQWGTFYGGSAGEEGHSCATDVSGNVYLAGSTNNSTGTIIATAGSHQSTIAGVNDAFLVKFNAAGVRQWGTYYGGTAVDVAYSCATDAASNVYLSGVTSSSNSAAISTPGSHQVTYGGGPSDAYLVKFNAAGVRQWCTYYGGSGDENNRNSVCSDGYGNVYMAGTTTSSLGTAIATGTGHQATSGGKDDAFLVKFDVCEVAPSQPTVINLPAAVCESIAATYNAPLFFGGNSYTWSFPSGWTAMPANNTIVATPGASGIFTLTVGNACGTSQQTLNITVNPLPTVSVNSGTVCFGQSFTLVPAGAFTYTYSSGPVVSPSVNSSYSVTGTSAAGCISSNTAVASVTVFALPVVTVTSGTICPGASFTITAGGASTYSYSGGQVVSPGVTSNYSVTGTDALGCSKTVLSTIVVHPVPIITVNSGAICLGQSFTIIPLGGTNYTFSGGPVVSPTVTSSYSVTGTNGQGCLSSNTAVTTITVSNIHPTISANSGSICQGETFTITPSGAATYTIQGGNALVTPASTSNYTVAGTSTAGCLSSNTAIASVTVNPLPTISVLSSNTLICEEETATLTAGGATNYTFNPGGVGASFTISPNTTSTYTITGTDANGCSNKATITQSVDACLGILTMPDPDGYRDEGGVRIFPNPNNGILNLDIPVASSASATAVQILNTLGQQVYSAKLSAGHQQLNLEHLAKGVYLLIASNVVGSRSLKIVKE